MLLALSLGVGASGVRDLLASVTAGPSPSSVDLT